MAQPALSGVWGGGGISGVVSNNNNFILIIPHMFYIYTVVMM